MNKAEELKKQALRTDVAFTSSSFLPDEPVYCFTEDELEQYAQQIAVEFMYWYEYPTMDKINCEDEFKEWTNHQNQSNE